MTAQSEQKGHFQKKSEKQRLMGEQKQEVNEYEEREGGSVLK